MNPCGQRRRAFLLVAVFSCLSWGTQASVCLNEVMASNLSTVTDEDGDSSDWIELLNAGEEAVCLSGWGLSDEAAAPFRWTFPYLILDPGAHLLVWASKKDRKPDAVLENNGVLIPESTAWKYWDSGTVPAGAWQSSAFDDGAWPTGTARFGTPLAAGGTSLAKSAANQFYPAYFFRRAFTLTAVPAAEQTGEVILRHHVDDGAVVWLNGTEVFRYKMPPGPVSYTNYTGDGYNVDYTGSWLTNTLDKALVLSLLQPGRNVCAVSLHESKAATSDALFDLGLRFQAGAQTALHTDFKLSASGCDVYLTPPGGAPADHVAVPVMPSDYSAGRSPDGGSAWRVFPVPTPGTTNNAALSYEGVVAEITPSVRPGFYADTVTLSLGTPTPDAAVYYTTDGATPTTNSSRYTAPIQLVNRSAETNALSLINTGNSGVFSIPSFGTVLNYVKPTVTLPKANVVRAIGVKPGWKDSPLFGGTWFVGPQTAGFTLPAVSLISDYTNFFGARGIYSNPSLANTSDWEYPLNAELFVDRLPVAGQLMGFRIHGGFSSGMAQKTLRLYARSEYGASSFGYPVFPEQPQYASYKRLLLRNGGNDWPRTLMRDALAQELCKHLRHDTQAYRPVNVFLNGEHWGIHNIRERYDEWYLNRVHGADPENVDIIGFPYGSSAAVADEGSAADFNALLTWLNANVLTDEASYAAVTGQVDVANYMDYMLANIFVVNKDWPGNNIKFWRTRTAEPGSAVLDKRWRWLMFDVDFAFAGWDADPVSTDMWAWTTSTTGSGRVCEAATRLFRKLLDNGGFRAALVSRYADQLNTTYRPWRVRALAEQMRDAIWPDMQGHIDRWPGGIRSLAVWTNEVEKVCAYARDRHGWEWRNLCARFNLATADVQVATSDIRHGIVQVNSVAVDTSTLGLTNAATPYPWRGTYVRQIPVTVKALPRAGHRFVRWSETGVTNETLSVALTTALQALTAVFEPDPEVMARRAVFLPPGESDWELHASWSTGVFPDWVGACAVIPVPAVLDSDGLPRRNVRVASAPVRVGHIEADNGFFSNRIRNKKGAPPGCALTFDGGTEPATLKVVGNDVGFTAVEMTAGVVLATDLRLIVSNAVGDAEYGALRLQAGWSGAGGLIKEGPGVCTLTGEGKTYTGGTRIREGVLSVTAPACPAQSGGVFVEAGGQLRLTSGTQAVEPPSLYAFGGTVALCSLGRAGFDGVAGAGAKGGLRYDPGGQGNRASLSAPLAVSARACVHVDDAAGDPLLCNELSLEGGVSGAAPLLKSGSGKLTLRGTAADMEGTVTVDNGFLEVDADMRGSGIVLDGSSAVLCGDGRVNGISGSGRVSPGFRSSGRLTAQSVGGPVDFSFRFTAFGESPEGNGRLALLFTEAPFAKVLDGENRVDVYFDAPPPEGGFALGGFETTSPADFTRFVALAEWRFYVSDPEGDVAYEGQRYAPCMVPLTVATVAQGAGRILKVSRPSHGYAQWAATYYTIAEQNDPATGGPLAKGADGVENLMRYALGLDRTTPVGPYLPQFTRAGGVLVYAYRRLTAEDSGLDYAVVTTDSLTASPASWQDAFEVDGLDVRLGPALATERPDVEVVTVEIIPTARQPLRFFRLRVTGP